jgi:hypothetical protein
MTATVTPYLVMDLLFTFTGKAGTSTDEKFEAFADRVLDALADLESADSGLTDADITASLTRREISISMRVEADTIDDARRIFAANVHTALHVAGSRTADWPFELEGRALPTAQQVDLAGA